MFRIQINIIPREGGFPRTFATVELPTASQEHALAAFGVFKNKFPAPDWSLSLTETKAISETIAASENW